MYDKNVEQKSNFFLTCIKMTRLLNFNPKKHLSMKQILLALQIVTVFILSSCNTAENLDAVSSNYSTMDSIQVHYKVHGDGENTLVFVHGWGCDLKVWDNQFDYFKDNYRLVFIDLPGFGQSDKPQIEYTLDMFAKSVKTVIDELNINRTTLIGHSLGFPVCRQVGRQYPEFNINICNVDGVYLRYPKDSLAYVNYKHEMSGFVNLFQGKNYNQNVKAFVDQFIKENTPEQAKEYILSTMTQTPQYVGSSTMTNLFHEKYWTEDITTTPTFSVYAQNEELAEDHVEYLKFLFPNTSYYEMDSVGHFLMMEKPLKFNRMLEEFILANEID
jgi:pimeloyl-ACP methyl ester carboxylesterase